jgi:hypothetical protein
MAMLFEALYTRASAATNWRAGRDWAIYRKAELERLVFSMRQEYGAGVSGLFRY